MEKKRKKVKVSPNATFNRRKKQLDQLKSTHPYNNGWWFYEYFRNILSGDSRSGIR